MITEQSILCQALAAALKSQGTLVICCPKCDKTREQPIEINALNKWAFTDGVAVITDGRGCCF